MKPAWAVLYENCSGRSLSDNALGLSCGIVQFIDVANNMSAPFDFVSGHIYPIESFAECPDANGGPHWNNDCMIEKVTPISNNVTNVWDANGVPLFVTEYAVAGIEGGASHQLDSSSAAAFIFRTIGQFDGVVDVLSCVHHHNAHYLSSFEKL
jgi:hypothetical protein